MWKRAVFLTLVLLAGAVNADPVYEAESCIQDKTDSCIDATPCKKISGITACLAGAVSPPTDAVLLTETCWQYEAAFTCRDSVSIDTCQPLKDKGCAQINTQCLTYKDGGETCVSSTLTMQCPVTPAKVVEKMVCDTSLCSGDGSGCFDTSHPGDKDMGKAAAMMEAAREVGTYGIDGDNVEVFKGYAEECSVKTLGGDDVKSCCSGGGGGQDYTNYAIIGMSAKVAYAVGKEEIKAGSKYVYDALFASQDAGLMESGMGAAAGGASSGLAEAGVGDAASGGADGAASGGSSFGAYGFQFSYSSAGGFSYVGFDPYSFALAVAIKIITEWMACTPEEQTFQLKQGQNLCVYLDSYCSSKVLDACVEKKERNCCFNSVIAKLINRQGRAQLGMDMMQCGGFNKDQLGMLDFSTMDFTEFIETVVPTNPDNASTSSDVTETATKKVNDYYGS